MIRFTTLGATDLRDGRGHPVRDVLAQPKRLALLLYLALEGRRHPIPRDTLLELFWPDSDRDRARNTLSQALHQLRQVIGAEVIQRHGTALQASPSHLWCDAAAFLDAVERQDFALAADLYRGDFCPGLLVGAAPRVEQWLDDQRRRLRAEADAVNRRLATTSAPPAAPRPRQRPTRQLVATMLSLIVVIAGAWALARPARDTDPRLLVIAPFPVISADTTLAFLGEGIADLVASDVAVPGVLEAADPRTVFGAWRRAGAALTERSEWRVARRLGAGQLVTGTIVGTSDRLVIAARYRAEGRPAVTLRVEGPLAQAHQLAAKLTRDIMLASLGEGAPEIEALNSVPTRALRSYILGRQAFRAGQYEQAAQLFGDALALDSTFARAALGGVIAADFIGGRNAPDFRRLAMAYRSRLSAADLAALTAFAGPRYPARSPRSEHLEAAEHLARIAPSRAESWYVLGDMLFHSGAMFGRDSAFVRAEAALSRAVALDSSFATPLLHLVQIAAWRDDPALVRSRARWYFALDSTSDEALFLRWRVAVATADSVARQSIENRLEALPAGTLRAISEWSFVEGISGPLALRAAALYARRTATSDERLYGARIGIAAAVGAGRYEEARRNLGILTAGQRDSAETARRFRSQYLLHHVGVPATAGAGEAGSDQPYVAYVREARTDSARLLRSLDSMRLASLDVSSTVNYYEARVRLAVGDTLGAGQAAARRAWATGGDQMLAELDRIAGLGLARAGDTAGAIRAWRRYLNLRAAPDPEAAGRRDEIAAALARLERP